MFYLHKRGNISTILVANIELLLIYMRSQLMKISYVKSPCEMGCNLYTSVGGEVTTLMVVAFSVKEK